MVFTEEGVERMEDEEGEGEEGQEREIVTNLILENLNRTQGSDLFNKKIDILPITTKYI